MQPLHDFTPILPLYGRVNARPEIPRLDCLLQARQSSARTWTPSKDRNARTCTHGIYGTDHSVARWQTGHPPQARRRPNITSPLLRPPGRRQLAPALQDCCNVAHPVDTHGNIQHVQCVLHICSHSPNAPSSRTPRPTLMWRTQSRRSNNHCPVAWTPKTPLEMRQGSRDSVTTTASLLLA